MKPGDKVSGNLFDNGTVIAVGTAEKLREFDQSGAVADGIDVGDMQRDTPSVAVDHGNGVAVYPEEEVWHNDSDVVHKFSHELSRGWKKYQALLGESPHGTQPQMAALLEISQFRQFIGQGKHVAQQQRKYRVLIDQVQVAEGTLLTVIRALIASEIKNGQVVEFWEKRRTQWGLIDGCNWSDPEIPVHVFDGSGMPPGSADPAILCLKCGNVAKHKIHFELEPHAFQGQRLWGQEQKTGHCVKCGKDRQTDIHDVERD